MNYPADALARFLASSDGGVSRYLVEIGGKQAGAVSVRYPWLKGPYLELLAILPAYQGAGVGSAILGWFEQEAIRLRARNLFVCASSFNARALRFYGRHGFQPAATLHGLVADGYDEILLRKSPARRTGVSWALPYFFGRAGIGVAAGPRCGVDEQHAVLDRGLLATLHLVLLAAFELDRASLVARRIDLRLRLDGQLLASPPTFTVIVCESASELVMVRASAGTAKSMVRTPTQKMLATLIATSLSMRRFDEALVRRWPPAGSSALRHLR